jgi:hypothetical protein
LIEIKLVCLAVVSLNMLLRMLIVPVARLRLMAQRRQIERRHPGAARRAFGRIDCRGAP